MLCFDNTAGGKGALSDTHLLGNQGNKNGSGNCSLRILGQLGTSGVLNLFYGPTSFFFFFFPSTSFVFLVFVKHPFSSHEGIDRWGAVCVCVCVKERERLNFNYARIKRERERERD